MRLKSGIESGELNRSGTDALIEYIKSDIDSRLEMLKEKADREIAWIEEKTLNEISDFESQQKKIGDEEIENEVRKMTNRNLIEKKKQSLCIVNSFIYKMIEEAASAVTADCRYHDYLVKSVVETVKEVKNSRITVKISGSDAACSDSIMKAVRDAEFDNNIEIIIDSSMKAGGAVIIDEDNEVVYNGTLERIFYRKRDYIRREILDILNKYRCMKSLPAGER